MDRGVIIFLIVATVSLGSVWAILSRPSRSSHILPSSPGETSPWPISSSFAVNDQPPSLLDPGVLPSSETDPAIPQEVVAPPRVDLLASIHTQEPPQVTERFPGTLAVRVFPLTDHSSPVANSQPLSARLKHPAMPGSLGPKGGELSREHDGALGWQYCIRDGDTLPELARRFYGDPEKWREIFEANRAVITDPNLLPVGAEIRIPYGAETTDHSDAPGLARPRLRP